MNDNLCQFLGIAKKAGKLVSGTEKVKKSVLEQKALLVLLSNEISAKTEKEFKFIAEKHGITVLRLNRTTAELSHATGTTNGVFSVTDRNFAERIKELGGTF